MGRIPFLKQDFEFRRVIFGVSCIVNTPPQHLPPIVNERMPDIVKQLAFLSLKMREYRVKILEDNEKHVAKSFKKIQQRETENGDFEDEEDEESGESDDDEKLDSDEEEK